MHNFPIVSIVDDDESVRVATSSLVRSLGWSAKLYASAEQFLASDDVREVSCIISDVQMPGISGLEMYRQLVDSGVTVPIIFISAFVSEAVRRQAVGMGAISVLRKPVDAVQVARDLASVKEGPGNPAS
ncbi:response regulator transcription factor [Burkholderia ambifaria]|uniref:response regulator transcription factor n=1 Tax=Burkholderia ambifaria TaxID=152480 RepID=UPI00158BB335|nr:response regulator [Burkholderia ambifaria]